jgi:hypothetical protein
MKSVFIHNRRHYHSAFWFDFDSSTFSNSQDASRENTAEDGQANEQATGCGAAIESASEPSGGWGKAGDGQRRLPDRCRRDPNPG